VAAAPTTDLVTPTLAGLVREHAATIGDHPAFTFEDRVLTYRDLDERSSRVAQGLRAAGLGAGDRVAVLDRNGLELFELLFGAAKIGAVLVAVNWRLAPAEMAYVVRDAGTRLLVVGTEFTDIVDEVAGDVSTVLVAGAAAGLDSWDAWVDRHPAEDPGAGAGPDDVAMQFYTSGTTGLPKGAMLTNANVFALVSVVSELLGMDADSVSLVAMPLFHVAGAGWAVFGLANGAHNVMLRDVDLPLILESIPRFGITHAVFVPAVLQFLLTVPGIDEVDFSSLEMIVYGASPISEDVLVRSIERFGTSFVQCYGLTETNGAVVVLPPEDHDPTGSRAHRLRSAGVALPGVELRVVDAAGADVPTGSVGEVWIRSPSNMSGYWNRPDETAAALDSEGWFRSGDAGSLDEDGYLYISDRVKDMIISGGENVYPAEVEHVLMAHPAVADVGVIGVPDDRWGEAVKAIVVRAPGSDPEPDELISWCRGRLAHYKCPTSIDWAELLPRNPSGKILKRELREPYWQGQDRKI
jgi:long-chain acyl-CoA synthetase